MDALTFAFAGGKRSCRALVGCAVLAVLVAIPAAAQPFDPDPNSTIQNSQSIESETTFDLFENEHDYALMPSYMGFFEDAGRFYTQLGNIGGEDMFQFLHYRPVGPGYLSFRVMLASEKFEVNASQQFEDFVDDSTPNDGNVLRVPNIVSDAEQIEFESSETDVYVGYGWPITDNGSLGFALNYFTNTVESEDTIVNIDDPRGPTGDDRVATDVFETEEEDETIKLIAEYMHRGDFSWRVRAFVSDVDHKIENSEVFDQLILIDNPDEEGGFCSFDVSCQDQGRDRSNAVYLFGNSEGGTPGSFNFLDRVSHDGNEFGFEGDLRWEKNPKVHHQLNVGISTGDFDPKENLLQQSEFTFTGKDVPAGNPDTLIQTFVDNHVIRNSDITTDNQFVTWKTRGHLGDTHVAVGLYLFNSDSELEITADSINQSTFQLLDGSAVTYSVTYGYQESFFTATRDLEIQTVSVPLALEQDVTSNVQVRLGAQYLRTSIDQEWTDIDTFGNFFVTSDPDGDGATAPTTTIFDDRFRETHTLQVEDTFDQVLYHAGLAVEWERVILEILLADSGSGGSDRDGIDLDTGYIGATFKLAKRN